MRKIRASFKELFLALKRRDTGDGLVQPADLRDALRMLNVDVPDEHFDELVRLFTPPDGDGFLYAKFLAWIRTNTEKPT